MNESGGQKKREKKNCDLTLPASTSRCTFTARLQTVSFNITQFSPLSLTRARPYEIQNLSLMLGYLIWFFKVSIVWIWVNVCDILLCSLLYSLPTFVWLLLHSCSCCELYLCLVLSDDDDKQTTGNNAETKVQHTDPHWDLKDIRALYDSIVWLTHTHTHAWQIPKKLLFYAK